MDNHWPDPLELIDLEYAVAERKTIAIIGDREFKIRYEEERFWVQPTDSFVPCGWFEYEHAFDEIHVKDE